MSRRKKSLPKTTPQVRLATSVRFVPSLSVLAGAAAIALIAFLAYLPSINGGFILDDDVLLTKNKLIQSADGLRRFWLTTEPGDYWPATNSTLWFEWRLWGFSPSGYHVTNLALHIVEALLICVILRKLSIPGAFLAALIFAVHPVNVESVAWIAQRKNLMALLFFLLSIFWYLKTDTPIRHSGPRLMGMASTPNFSSFVLHPSSFYRWYWLSLLAFVLAMLSKASAAVLPLLVLLIVWWRRRFTRWDILRTAPYFLVVAALGAVNLWFRAHGAGGEVRIAGFMECLLGAGGVVWFYLYKAILPLSLVFVYPQWEIHVGNMLWWLPLISAVVVTAALWFYKDGWGRPLLFAWGFFCLSLLPVMGFMDVGFMEHSLVADHYQHIAIIGVIALAAAGWGFWHARDEKADLCGNRRRGTACAGHARAIDLAAKLTLLQCHDPIPGNSGKKSGLLDGPQQPGKHIGPGRRKSFAGSDRTFPSGPVSEAQLS